MFVVYLTRVPALAVIAIVLNFLKIIFYFTHFHHWQFHSLTLYETVNYKLYIIYILNMFKSCMQSIIFIILRTKTK